MRRLLVIILLAVGSYCQADYLKAYRNTNLRVEPRAGADEVKNGDVKAGDRLILIDTFQTRGYYHVKKPGIGVEGWIYRSLVKYVEGVARLQFIENYQGPEVTIIDVGAGLACLIKVPGPKYFMFDAGGNGYHAYRYLSTKLDKEKPIELMILSHTDDDHWGSVAEIAGRYQIKEALYTSYRHEELKRYATGGLAALKAEPGIKLTDIAEIDIDPGTVLYEDGPTKLTLVSGFGAPPAYWGLSDTEATNAVSLIVRLDYYDQSVLFTGDAVGMHDCEPDCECHDECIASEQFMVDSVGHLLKSNVLIAAHHGADNASCPKFIKAVLPDYVIFSAGNSHKHPRQRTAERFMAAGLREEQLLRTDKGRIQADSNRDCADEWDGWNSTEDGKDRSEDDHILIQLTSWGESIVGYLD